MTTTGSRAVIGTLILTTVFASAARGQDDDQWTRPGKDLGATRYSDLAEITAANVSQLRPTWTFSTGVLGGHEGQPLVVDENPLRRHPVSQCPLRVSTSAKKTTRFGSSTVLM